MTSRSLSDLLEPLYTLAKFTGILPFDQHLQLSRKWWIISIILLALISVKGFVVRLYLLIAILPNENHLLSFIQFIVQSLSISIVCSHLFSICHFKNKLARLGRTVAVLSDGYSYNLYVPTVYTTVGILLLILWFIVNTTGIHDNALLIALIFLSVVEVVIHLHNMTFCMFLEILHEHFKGIINDISYVSLELTTKKSLILISACEDISEIYGLALLFSCPRILVFTIVVGHSIATDLQNFDDVSIYSSIKSLFREMFLSVMVIFSTVMITGSCRRIQASLNRFNDLVFREFRRRPNLMNNNSIKLYITKNPLVHFSACGFFSIENSLLTAILAKGVTYVIIFFQFYMPSPR